MSSSAFTSSNTYDNAGNRLTKVLNGATETYTYDNANKMLTAGSKSYSYDNAGNVTAVTWTGGSRTLTWDAESRLKSTTSAGSTVNYAYNGLGQRVTKSGAATAAYLLGDDRIDAEVLSDGSATYAHGVAGLVSENRGGTTRVYHSDALSSVRALTNISGTVTDSRSTDAFGGVVTTTGTTATPFGFAGGHGYQQDSETGLMRLGHRMYDSSTGRFISRDPIQDGYNWYAYCNGDPVNVIDPSGLKVVDAGDIAVEPDPPGTTPPPVPPRPSRPLELAPYLPPPTLLEIWEEMGLYTPPDPNAPHGPFLPSKPKPGKNPGKLGNEPGKDDQKIVIRPGTNFGNVTIIWPGITFEPGNKPGTKPALTVIW
jgi:RHS repeat-associated protein